jgi:hypothetical protein
MSMLRVGFEKYERGEDDSKKLPDDSKITVPIEAIQDPGARGTTSADGERPALSPDRVVEIEGSKRPKQTMRAHITASLKDGNADLFLREVSKYGKIEKARADFPFKKLVPGIACGYRPSLKALSDIAKKKSKFIIGPSFFPEVCVEMIGDLLDKGLIVVCGETGSGKSDFVQQLIFGVLRAKANLEDSGQNPLHLVTYEDPVEKPFFIKHVNGAPKSVQPYYAALDPCQTWVQATHRELGQGCPGVKEFFLSALRQKPALAYVGETREPSDWDHLVRFAMTGHLAVTTCHAGSIRECLSKVLLETGSDKSPAKRNFVASALLCVIHLQVVSKTPYKIVLPSMYVFDQAGTARLTADNLDSVLPGYELPSLGYCFFREKLESHLAQMGATKRITDCRSAVTGAKPGAIGLDLCGQRLLKL